MCVTIRPRMGTPASIRVVIAALFVSALSLFVPFPAPLRAAAGMLLAFVLPGLVFLLLAGIRRPAGLHRLVAAPVLSPVVLGVLVLAVHAAVGSFESSVTISVLVLEALLAIALLRTGGDDSATPSLRAVALPLSILFGGIVAACYLLNPGLLMRSDAWYHASVASEILDRGIPPLEPWLPDVPIRYMWIYHLFVASTMRLAGVGVFAALGAFNVAAAFVFPWLAARMVLFFAKDRKSAFAIALVVVAGLQSAAWVFFPLGFARAFIGETRGAEELARMIRHVDLDSFRVIYFLSPFEEMSGVGNYMVNLADKYLTITAFGFALNVFLLAFLTALSAGLRGRLSARVAVLAFALALEALLFHAIVGMALVLSLVGSGILMAAAGRLRFRDGVSATHSIGLPVAAIAAALCGLPYIYSLTAGGSSGGDAGTLHLGIRNAVTIALPLVLLWKISFRAFRDLWAMETEQVRIAAAWIASLAALCLFANLPTRNESKLLYPFFLLLSPFVAGRLFDAIRAATGGRRAVIVAWAVILFAVPFVLTIRGFALDRPTNPVEARRAAVTGDDQALFDWIAANTPAETAILENNIYNMMPIRAHRRNFFPDPGTVNVLGYGGAKVEAYRTARDALFSPEPSVDEAIKALQGAGAPVLVLLWREDLEERPYLLERFDALAGWFEPVYRNAEVRAYALRIDRAHDTRKEDSP
ncbi:MAG: hypothetical protein C4574_04585 [Candidatus Latescibacterota bacterium]|nr:MAG: hypothetical protein C4574_04585 [Candidatus Latescibacterota bacterium]